MTERVIGPTGSPRRRWTLLVPLTLALALGLMYIAGAQAVHDDGFFELDRNATSGAAPGEDWDVVYAGTDTAGASSFVADDIGPTIFTGGGSKDDLNTTGWKHKSGQTPDKDELLNGYAARYGDIVYFGADRYSNSGDAVMGFWFFQNEVTAQSDGSFGPDAHEDGDILVLSDFTKGGGNVTIRVYQWNGPGGSIAGSGAINGTLDLLAGTTESPADCVGPPAVSGGDPYCATVNTANETSPWPFQAKASGSPANVFPPGHFFEGGIDLDALDLGDECFASFLAETRSSTSVDAVLKDFVGGEFEECESGIVTTPSSTSITFGQTVTDGAVVTGSGAGTPTGTVKFYICTPSQLDDPGLVNGQPDNPNTCDIGGTLVDVDGDEPNGETLVPHATDATKAVATSDAVTGNVVGTWCFRGEYVPAAGSLYDPAVDSATTECFTVQKINPALNTTQRVYPNDSATITSSGGDDLAGTLVFTLYDTQANCTAGTGTGVLYTETFTISDDNDLDGTGGDSETRSTTNGNGQDGTDEGPGDYAETANATRYWRVTYASTNPAHFGRNSLCQESTQTTFMNDSSGGTAPTP